MKTSIYSQIIRLVSYGINTGLIESEDKTYIVNTLMGIYNLTEPDGDYDMILTDDNEENLEEILKNLLDLAYKKELLPENTITYRDLFDVKLMSVFVKRPSEIIKDFWRDYDISPESATDNYYKLSCDSDYIRRYRIKKDLKWKTSTEYGDIDITINLSPGQ